MIELAIRERYRFDGLETKLLDNKRIAREAGQRLMFCSLDYQPDKKFGYGFPYTSQMAETLLGMPLSAADTLLSKEGEDFYYGQIRKDRGSFDFGPQKNLSGIKNWYFQGMEPTCVPYSAVNLAKSYQVDVNPKFLAELLNRANHSNRTINKPGLHNEVVKQVLGKHQNIDLKYEGDADANLSVDQYASAIKIILDKNCRILEAVGGDYYNDDNPSLHQIAIVGYEINERGQMDVEVVDSNMGVVMLPIDFINRVRSDEIAVLSKRQQVVKGIVKTDERAA